MKDFNKSYYYEVNWDKLSDEMKFEMLVFMAKTYTTRLRGYQIPKIYRKLFIPKATAAGKELK